MNFIEKIKNIFKPKKEEIKDNTTTISLYDVSDVNVPSFNELSKDNQDKVIKYQKEIDINNLENIIKYNQETSKNGEELSNLLIKYLYEEIEKNNKSAKELQEIDINSCIQNMKIIVIRNMIKDLLKDSYLKTIALENIKKDYENKEHKFIEIFSRAARIKRNMEIRSIDESITRSKITIKTLEQQIKAVNNAINNNDVLIDKMNIYNKLINKIQKDNTRKTIYVNKLEYLIDITKQLKCHFSKLYEISNLLKLHLNEDIEQQILENFAITELELDRFITKNKDKMVTEYMTKITDFGDITITHENKDELLKEAEYLQIIEEVFKDYIDESYREDVYEIKFNILTFDINNQTERYSKFKMYLPRDDYHKEMERYIKIISNEINNINQGISPVAKNLQETGKLKKVIKLLNSHFKSFDGKYRYEDILFYREKLALLLAFQSEEKFNEFFKKNKYVVNGPEVHDSIILPWYSFEWNNQLPLETIYTLYEVYGKEKPKFYDIYKLYYKDAYIPGHAPNFPDDIYYLPEGIEAIIGGGVHQDREFITYIQKKSDDKVVVLPSTLKEIYLDVFGPAEIKDIVLNNGLEYIGSNVFLKQHLKKISFPASLRDIDQNSFNFSSIEEIEFKNYKDSKLLYNLLYRYTMQYKSIIQKLFNVGNLDDIEKYTKYGKNRPIVPKIKKIILSDKEEKIELTYPEIYNAINRSPGSIWNYFDKVRYFISDLIEQKTGINLKEYHEQKHNKNK